MGLIPIGMGVLVTVPSTKLGDTIIIDDISIIAKENTEFFCVLFCPKLVRAVGKTIQMSGINLNNFMFNFQVLILIFFFWLLSYLIKLWEMK